MQAYGYIGENLLRIKEACAARASSLGLPTPMLLAVTKSASPEEVAALVRTYGQGAIAENRTSLFSERYEMFGEDERPEIHLIGSLQTNKVKTVVGRVTLIHSLDSLRLAAEIEKQSEKRGTVTDVLIEINSGREPAKGGILPEDAQRFADALTSFSHLRVRGLMTMAPICESEEAYRPYFRLTANIHRTLDEQGYYSGTPILSMGMSNSYLPAIEEGATLIRVGRALFAR